MAINIADVAQHAGVSTASVSRVLSGKPYVSDVMRARVQAAVTELGYRPSRVARSLRARRANIIGLIVSDIQNPFFTAIVRGVEDIAYERQCGVFLCNSDEASEKEALYVDLMLAEQVSGVIVSPSVAGAPYYARLQDAGIPVVAIDRQLPDLAVDTVVVDNAATASLLVERLIEAGHRRIGAVIGSDQATTGSERRLGYERALAAHGLTADPALMQLGVPKANVGYQAALALLDCADPPTAIFVGNNLLTMGVLRALRQRRFTLGRDIELAAFDEMDWMNVLDAPLMMAAQPTYEMGQCAAELLFARIGGMSTPPRRIVLETAIHGRSGGVVPLQQHIAVA